MPSGNLCLAMVTGCLACATFAIDALSLTKPIVHRLKIVPLPVKLYSALS